mgnify:CR=1 FL=1
MQHPGAQRAMGVTVNAIAFAAVSMEKLCAVCSVGETCASGQGYKVEALQSKMCNQLHVFNSVSGSLGALILLPVVFTSTLVKLHQEN